MTRPCRSNGIILRPFSFQGGVGVCCGSRADIQAYTECDIVDKRESQSLEEKQCQHTAHCIGAGDEEDGTEEDEEEKGQEYIG